MLAYGFSFWKSETLATPLHFFLLNRQQFQEGGLTRHGLNPWRLWPWCSRILFHICDDAVALCPCILALMVWNCSWQCIHITCSKLNQQSHSCIWICCLLVVWFALLDVEQGFILTKLQHDSKISCHHLLLRLLKLRLHACPSVFKQKIRCPPRILETSLWRLVR